MAVPSMPIGGVYSPTSSTSVSEPDRGLIRSSAFMVGKNPGESEACHSRSRHVPGERSSPEDPSSRMPRTVTMMSLLTSIPARFTLSAAKPPSVRASATLVARWKIASASAWMTSRTCA